MEEVERNHILAILNQTGWVIEGLKGAARVLNLHSNTLRSRTERLGIRRGGAKRPEPAVRTARERLSTPARVVVTTHDRPWLPRIIVARQSHSSTIARIWSWHSACHCSG
jgi:regulatory Fis family protein